MKRNRVPPLFLPALSLASRHNLLLPQLLCLCKLQVECFYLLVCTEPLHPHYKVAARIRTKHVLSVLRVQVYKVFQVVHVVALVFYLDRFGSFRVDCANVLYFVHA